MKERLKTADVIMVSHNPENLKQYCTHAAILHGGRLTETTTLEEAMKTYKKILAK